LVVAGNLRACRLSDTPISAGEAAGIPRGPEGLEEPPLDSAAMTAGTADPYLVGVLHVCGNGKHERALMTKFLAFLGLLALTGGVATISTLISPP
jgi:hypothetical protein